MPSRSYVMAPSGKECHERCDDPFHWSHEWRDCHELCDELYAKPTISEIVYGIVTTLIKRFRK